VSCVLTGVDSRWGGGALGFAERGPRWHDTPTGYGLHHNQGNDFESTMQSGLAMNRHSGRVTADRLARFLCITYDNRRHTSERPLRKPLGPFVRPDVGDVAYSVFVAGRDGDGAGNQRPAERRHKEQEMDTEKNEEDNVRWGRHLLERDPRG